MPEAAAILARLDAIVAELAELRAAVTAFDDGRQNLPDEADDTIRFSDRKHSPVWRQVRANQ